MPFLIGLISFYLVFWGISYFAFRLELASAPNRAAMAAGCMFILIGIAHFAKKEMIEKILVGLTKHIRLANFVSGAFEILFGIGMFFESTRLWSALGLILLLIAIFPANVNHARISPTRTNKIRLYYQPVYIFWVWYAIDFYWPFG